MSVPPDGRIVFKQVTGHDLSAEWGAVVPGVRRLVILAAHASFVLFKVPVVVTTLFRTATEERTLYPNDPGRVSAHQLGRACDLRVLHAPDPTAYATRLRDELTELDPQSRWLFEGLGSGRTPHLHGELTA